MDQDNEMEVEFGAHLRTTAGDPFLASLKSLKFKDRNPVEQFYSLVDGVFFKLKELNIPFIHVVNLEEIIDSINRINKPEYKNAIGYILGFYASNSGRGISQSSLEMVFKILPTLNNLAIEHPICRITKPDIIRYARLWTNLK